MKEIKATFKTLTPLWTGDAWGENTEIRPSSIIGGFRFWFEVYCQLIGCPIGKMSEKGIPSDNLDDYVKGYNKRNKIKETFYSLLEKELKDYSYNNALINVLNKIELPLPSKIFGCTGWKSQIEIERIDFSKYELKKSDIDFSALYDKLNTVQTQSSEFWANKLLFTDKKEIILFEDIQIFLFVNETVEEEFMEFLKFYKGKIIVIGSKKSFGFGFCKLETDLQLDSVALENENKSFFDYKKTNIQNLNLKNDKVILGFNFKHYQRLKEQKRFREKNFGKQSKASNFFFSTKLKNQNEIYIIGFKEGMNDNLFNNLFSRYSEFGGN